MSDKMIDEIVEEIVSEMDDEMIDEIVDQVVDEMIDEMDSEYSSQKVVYKHEIFPGTSYYDFGVYDEILHVGEQGDEGRIFMWVIHHLDTAREKVRIDVYPTGVPLDSGNRIFHIGTVVTKDDLVWHVFERVGDI